ARVHRRHDEVPEHVRVGLLEERGVDVEPYHLELPAHHSGHHAAARARLDRALGQFLLDARDLLLQLLRLPEEPTQVEALTHRALPAPVPHAAHLGAKDLDRSLHHRIGERLLGAPPGLRERRLAGVLARQRTHLHPEIASGDLARDGAQALQGLLARQLPPRRLVLDSDAESFAVGPEQRHAFATRASTTASGRSATSARSPVAASTARWRKCSRRSRQKRCASYPCACSSASWRTQAPGSLARMASATVSTSRRSAAPSTCRTAAASTPPPATVSPCSSSDCASRRLPSASRATRASAP